LLDDHFEQPSHTLSIDPIKNIHASKNYGHRLMARVPQHFLPFHSMVHP
jgi:hypothetical protein